MHLFLRAAGHGGSCQDVTSGAGSRTSSLSLHLLSCWGRPENKGAQVDIGSYARGWEVVKGALKRHCNLPCSRPVQERGGSSRTGLAAAQADQAHSVQSQCHTPCEAHQASRQPSRHLHQPPKDRSCKPWWEELVLFPGVMFRFPSHYPSSLNHPNGPTLRAASAHATPGLAPVEKLAARSAGTQAET